MLLMIIKKTNHRGLKVPSPRKHALDVNKSEYITKRIITILLIIRFIGAQVVSTTRESFRDGKITNLIDSGDLSLRWKVQTDVKSLESTSS